MSTPETMRAWAKGAYNLEAGVELLIRSGLADSGALSRHWSHSSFDWEGYLASVEDGGWSGGQFRLLRLATNLLLAEDLTDDRASVDLGWAMSGLDRVHLHLALAALAHAGGSHQHSDVTFDDEGLPTFEGGYLPPLVDWPAARP